MKYMKYLKSQTALFSCQKFLFKGLHIFTFVNNDDEDNNAVANYNTDDVMYIATALAQLC